MSNHSNLFVVRLYHAKCAVLYIAKPERKINKNNTVMQNNFDKVIIRAIITISENVMLPQIT